MKHERTLIVISIVITLALFAGAVAGHSLYKQAHDHNVAVTALRASEAASAAKEAQAEAIAKAKAEGIAQGAAAQLAQDQAGASVKSTTTTKTAVR